MELNHVYQTFKCNTYFFVGAYLPPPQIPLAAKYKEELWEHFGIVFNKLYTITNMPIKRFNDFLYRR